MFAGLAGLDGGHVVLADVRRDGYFPLGEARSIAFDRDEHANLIGDVGQAPPRGAERGAVARELGRSEPLVRLRVGS
jgi:hypothetical protein